jgi:hypothetical protein
MTYGSIIQYRTRSTDKCRPGLVKKIKIGSRDSSDSLRSLQVVCSASLQVCHYFSTTRLSNRSAGAQESIYYQIANKPDQTNSPTSKTIEEEYQRYCHGGIKAIFDKEVTYCRATTNQFLILYLSIDLIDFKKKNLLKLMNYWCPVVIVHLKQE